MEFHPVPDDLSAMSEVAGDEELVLEEETLDADNGDNGRWIPKIADVDEDEVVAAEERGEQIFGPDTDEEEEEEAGEEEETNGHASVRAPSPTSGYQQRQTERPGYDRRGFRDRNRRGGPRRGNFRARPNTNRNLPLISDLLKEGQEVLIQIAKEPIGKKGARITSHIALPGRFLVYMPTVNHVGVSRKIASEEERLRLKRIVTSERENGLGGFIVRTAAVNIKEEDLRADIRFLKHLWAEIKSRAENSKSPALIYHDLNLVERVLRDQVNADFSQIWVDTEDEYERVVRFASRFQPSLVRRIKLYTKDTPLFEQFGIQDEINRSLKSKVWLKSGGHIVINQTEALVAIDINTGKYVGKTQRLEDTIAKTNVDAVKEIVRQIRLRDLGWHHRHRLHRHGRAQESPEGDAGARRGPAQRSRSVEGAPVQRFRIGCDYPQTREAIAGAHSGRDLPLLRGRGLCEVGADRLQRALYRDAQDGERCTTRPTSPCACIPRLPRP